MRTRERERAVSDWPVAPSERLAFVGRMAAGVAHEIRNPLNIADLVIQKLHHELAKNKPKQEYTTLALQSLQRIGRLVEELMNCARPPKFKMKPWKINQVVASALRAALAKQKKNKVKLQCDYKVNLPLLQMDRQHMEQVFLNLYLNAIEAMPKGGILSIQTEKENNCVLVKVKDTGCGISSKNILRIFDPFFSTKKSGRGLGLAVSYGIIGAHKGTITVDSKKGRGSLFTVKLPLNP